jgi:hypothetical protein
MEKPDGFSARIVAKEELDALIEEIATRQPFTTKQKGQISNLFHSNINLFDDSPGVTHLYTHEIKLHDESPFYLKSYPIPAAYQNTIQQKIQEMIRLDVIKEAPTSYVSPMLVIIKKDKSPRCCLDLRQLNRQLYQEHTKPANMNEELQKFHGTKYFSSVDLVSGYWQIPVKEEHQKYLGFQLGNKTYVFRRLPFGMSTSVSSFVRAMEIILGPEVMRFTTLYIDDALVASKSFEDHLIHLNKIFDRFALAGITLNLLKSRFFCEEINFVGWKITSTGICVEDRKLIEIAQYPVPKNVKQVKSFLGVIGFIRKTIPKLSELTYPLNKLTKKFTKFLWDEECQKSFKKIKELCSSAPLLQHPCSNKPFFVQTDSSFIALAAVLYQEDDNNQPNIIRFDSRLLKGAEIRYTITELEALAIVWALQKWRYYLLGRRFIIRTDHRALLFLKQCVPPNDRLMRYIIFLQAYDFEVEFIKGTENYFADFLSRPQLVDTVKSKSKVIQVYRIKLMSDFSKKIRHLGQLQDKEVEMRILKQEIMQSGGSLQNYYVLNNILFVKIKELWLICAPKSLLRTILYQFHVEWGHLGVHKTWKLISNYFFLPKLRKFIK